MKRLITSIDIGTTKISVLIGHSIGKNQINIIGIGTAQSHGLEKGVVVDIAKTIYSIESAVKEAELMADIKIESAHIGISGSHISSCNSHGIIPIKRGQIRKSDIHNVLAAAEAIPIPEGMQILHILPQFFIIDGHEKVHDPLGMYGIRLEVQAHIIMGAVSSVHNLINCCQNSGIQVKSIILEQLASADSVLSDDEKKLGVAILDIGGGTSDLAIYQNGSIRHTMVLPIAGNHFTNDLAIGLRITRQEAERIKKKYGMEFIDPYKITDSLLEVEMVHGNDKQIITHSDIIRILQPRAEELLSFVHKEIIEKKLESFITTGLVITGGGSLLTGIDRIAEKICNIPVRLGRPHIFFDLPETLKNPIYATGYGILLHVLGKEQKNINNGDTPTIHRVVERMKSWVLDFF